MSENTLDRLSREHGDDVRRWLAALIHGGATRPQIVRAFDEKYGTPVSIRSITSWRKSDERLVAYVDELTEISKALAADDPTNPGDLLKPRVDEAKVDLDIMVLTEEHPAWGALMMRAEPDAVRERAEAATDYYGKPIAPVVGPTTAEVEWVDDAVAVLAAEHETPEAFEADAISRLTDVERDEIAHLLIPA